MGKINLAVSKREKTAQEKRWANLKKIEKEIEATEAKLKKLKERADKIYNSARIVHNAGRV